jgi:DNA polymerase III delta subunit
MIVAGSEDFLRDREFKRVISAAHAARWRVSSVSSQSELDDETSTALTFGEKAMITAETLKLDFSVFQPKTGLSALVRLNTDDVPKELPEHAKVALFERPKSRKDKKNAAESFAVAEARRLGTPLANKDLADALVATCGDDLGVIHWEVFKASLLVKSSGGNEISREVISKTARASSGIDVSAVVDSLAVKDTVSLAKALQKIRAREKDASMLLLRGKGGPADAALLWLRIASSREQDQDALAARLGVPVWALRNRELGAARLWKTEGCKRLLRALSAVDKGIIDGRVPNPWLACESALLVSCSENFA